MTAIWRSRPKSHHAAGFSSRLGAVNWSGVTMVIGTNRNGSNSSRKAELARDCRLKWWSTHVMVGNHAQYRSECRTKLLSGQSGDEANDGVSATGHSRRDTDRLPR